MSLGRTFLLVFDEKVVLTPPPHHTHTHTHTHTHSSKQDSDWMSCIPVSALRRFAREYTVTPTGFIERVGLNLQSI